jgi:hypothetical protein
VSDRRIGRLSAEERARVLLECWWSHDGQWFLKARAAHGLEAAMQLNEDAVESVGRIEMRRLHAALGSPKVRSAADFMPLVLAAHDLIEIEAVGEEAGPDAFVIRETECRVWAMTQAADLEAVTPGCRGSMRRRLGWATVFFPRARISWERIGGPPDGEPPCAYRFTLAPESP